MAAAKSLVLRKVPAAGPRRTVAEAVAVARKAGRVAVTMTAGTTKMPAEEDAETTVVGAKKGAAMAEEMLAEVTVVGAMIVNLLGKD